MLLIQTESQNLKMRADDLEHINNNYKKDKQNIYASVSKCIAENQKLVAKTDIIFQERDIKLHKETELKMCKYTENLMSEFKFLNKRLEDTILFKIGYY